MPLFLVVIGKVRENGGVQLVFRLFFLFFSIWAPALRMEENKQKMPSARANHSRRAFRRSIPAQPSQGDLRSYTKSLSPWTTF
jgi:hypothetical protein